MKCLENTILFMSPKGMMQFDGSPPRLVSEGPWIPKGALKPDDRIVIGGLPFKYAGSCCGTWASEPVNFNLKRNTMKPGPYKSSIYGDIHVSMRARELLAAERDAVQGAVQGAIRSGNFSVDNQALSRARGEIALHIADLEMRNENQRQTINVLNGRQKTATEIMTESQNATSNRSRATYDRLLNLMNETPRFYADHGFDPRRYKKETPVTEKTEPAEKTRSQLIGEATHELVQAQHTLEAIQATPSGIPDGITVYAQNGAALVSAVADLMKEQWAPLEKKAVARAKARVAKAEKAVAALLT